MKRYLLAFGIGAMVFAGVLGSAAALNINDPGVAQYGESFDLACDEDGVTIEGYFPDTDAGIDSVSNGVVVSGIDAECFGKTLVAGATDASGNGLSRGFVEIDADTEIVRWGSVDGPDTVLYADLGGIRLTIG